jgi:hypothetical protein
VSTYDSLLDEDPDIQERVARGKIQGQQNAVIELVEIRFPALIERAKQQIVGLNRPEDLSRLMRLIATAPDEAVARWILDTFAV